MKETVVRTIATVASTTAAWTETGNIYQVPDEDQAPGWALHMDPEFSPEDILITEVALWLSHFTAGKAEAQWLVLDLKAREKSVWEPNPKSVWFQNPCL